MPGCMLAGANQSRDDLSGVRNGKPYRGYAHSHRHPGTHDVRIGATRPDR